MPHHAYIYEGSLALLPMLAADARARFGFEGEHSPDAHVREFEKFGIGESRWLVETAALRSSGGRALFVLGVAAITSEAQQALLKLFEEPQAGVVFVLLMPHGAVLPTLRSRMMEYPARQLAPKKVLGSPVSGQDSRGPDHFSERAAAPFLSSSQKERSAQIAALLKDEDGVKERVREFIGALEAQLAPRIAEPRVREGLEDIAKVRSYVGDRSAALKMLLEHLAVSLPKA